MRTHKLLWASSYDRGLFWLLQMWPDIRKKYPDATLSICYGWKTYDALMANNPERQQWKVHMISMMHQEGVKELGRLGKDELNKLTDECGILAYCSDFFEIFCINVVNSQLRGCVPVTTSKGALVETNKCGIIVDGDITDKEVQKEYLNALLDLMGDERKRAKMAKEGKEWAKKFDWSLVAKDWSDEMKSVEQTVKLSVYTPTIRKGFWNIMADNLNKQTYKNFEWIIVDDYPEDRSKIAKEYAEKYNLDIKYTRGKERKIKRTYGLCNANNTALALATGEVLVFLQDFILMPLDGLEQIATLYRRNPTALQGLPDMYFSIKGDVDTEKEDWFNGNIDVVGEFQRQNVRIANLGLRPTNNPRDFEQNYGAIPVKIARELGGWWEFYDFGLGYDNTSIAFRALQAGYPIIIDETNVAICLDIWPYVKGKTENGGMARARRLNDPLYMFEVEMIKAEKLPLKRTQELDDQIELTYEVPKEVSDDDIEEWLSKNYKPIVLDWMKKYDSCYRE